MGWHGMNMDMNMNMNVDMLLTETCCRYLFSCEKKRETTDVGSHFLRFTSIVFSSSSSTKT